MMDEPVSLILDNRIARIRLNRPSVGNAIDLPLARSLLDMAIRCEADPAIRCVVLEGSGKLFCAGGDIRYLGGAGDALPRLLAELIAILNAAVTRLARMPKPLLVLVNGPAAGAGLSLAILGDIVLSARSAHFTTAYGAIGLTADGGLSWLLPRLIGLRKAQEMIFTNRRVRAEEAEAIGLVTRVVDDEMLESEGLALAHRLARGSTPAIDGARRLLYESFETGLELHLDRELRSMASAGAGDAQEGLAALLAQRSPAFKGA